MYIGVETRQSCLVRMATEPGTWLIYPQCMWRRVSKALVIVWRRNSIMRLRSQVVWFLVVAALTMVLTPRAGAQTRAAGELVWAWHVTLAPSWFDPGEVPAQITPFSLIYAMHDAVVRAMPGERMGNSLAESWTESPDGLVYE